MKLVVKDNAGGGLLEREPKYDLRRDVDAADIVQPFDIKDTAL
jgi:hypothetical protein